MPKIKKIKDIGISVFLCLICMLNCAVSPKAITVLNNEISECNTYGATIGDPMVYYTQKWLNQEYGSVSGFGSVMEDGITGWDTIYGLLRALQHELGITSLANSFGPTTSSLYANNPLHRQDGVTDKKFAILQGALWCKGYCPGYNITERTDGTIAFNAVFDEGVEYAVKQLQEDAGISNKNGVVSLNLMKALMSMDSFKLLPPSYGGDGNVRIFQQWLNNNYESYTGLNPCDGVYSRNTNTALIYALQAEEGLPLSVANGNFGNTTQLCCPEIPYTANSTAARRYPGTSNSDFYTYSEIVNFTKLLQFSLYVNGFGDGVFDGIFDNETEIALRNFQEHHAITISGNADKGTWLSLFISSGDRNRPAIAADCATILTKPKAEALYANGYRYIGRYLTGTYGSGISKALTRQEAEIILDAGLRFFPIYQTSARENAYFTPKQGTADAKAAVAAALALGIPKDTIIYFAVDFDAMDYQITSNIIPYFSAVHEEMSFSIYKTGIYGARNVCTRVSECGYAISSFVGNMSTGFSGNLGFKMPDNWAFDQFADRDQSGNYLLISSTDGSFEIDKNGFSGRNHGVVGLDSVGNPSLDTANIISVPAKTGIIDEINKYLRGIMPGGKVEDYFSVTSNGTIYQIPNSSYRLLNATGTRVQAVPVSGTVFDTYTIVILGDINGDSAIDAADQFCLNLYLNGHTEIDGAYLAACDISGDGTVNKSDYNHLRRIAVGDFS